MQSLDRLKKKKEIENRKKNRIRLKSINFAEPQVHPGHPQLTSELQNDRDREKTKKGTWHV